VTELTSVQGGKAADEWAHNQ